MKKKIMLIIALIIVSVGSHNMYFSHVKDSIVMSDLLLVNAEALANNDESKKCPNAYDVYDQHSGTFKVDANLEISIMGKKFKVATIYANCAINVLYGVGHCRRESPGNCCPYEKIGDVKLYVII